MALVDDDPWGKLYKQWVRRPISGIHMPQRMEATVDGLFPTQAHRAYKEWPFDEPVVAITESEVKKLALGISGNKAPGSNSISGGALKLLAKTQSVRIADVFNRCIEQGIIPAAWKRARLVLLRKTNRPLEEPNSYRPLCMLDSMRKLIKKIIDTRLKTTCKANELLTPNQYCFRRGKSTIDAISHVMHGVNNGLQSKCMVGILLLDVKNAFNSAPWRVIAESLQSKVVPGYICRLLDDYFDGSALLYDVVETTKTRES